MATLRKATAQEVRDYAARVPAPLYPLTHWVKADGHWCPVEGLFEGDGNPNYEIMFPEGTHDAEDLTHSFLCVTLADVRERAKYARFVACTTGCN